MQKYFEKIKERSREEKLKVMLPDGFRSECVTLRTLETIVNQVAEEYKDTEMLSLVRMIADFQKEKLEELRKIQKEFATDTNVGNKDGWIPCSGCSECKHKECEHYGKV